MPDHEFLFALEMTDDPDSSRMAADLCAAVLGYVGYAPAAVAELNRELHDALRPQSNGVSRCDLRFVAHAGELQIVVARTGAAEWRTTRRLPAP